MEIKYMRTPPSVERVASAFRRKNSHRRRSAGRKLGACGGAMRDRRRGGDLAGVSKRGSARSDGRERGLHAPHPVAYRAVIVLCRRYWRERVFGFVVLSRRDRQACRIVQPPVRGAPEGDEKQQRRDQASRRAHLKLQISIRGRCSR